MTYFLASAFLFLILNLHETHSFVSLSQWLSDLLGPEAAHQPGLGSLQDELQQEAARESYEDMTPPPAPEDAGNTFIARSRRKGSKKSQKLIAKCYMCNSLLPNWNHTSGILAGVVKMIPPNTLCHDAWDSDRSVMRLRSKFRSHCYLDLTRSTLILGEPIKYPKRFDRGSMRNMYGNYTGGCFKRFLDVGEELYTARGCRRWSPRVSSGYASQRFRSLERLLRDEKDACISSPHASLTPFSRGVSLYVRYHVCVCSGSYCNPAPPAPAPAPALALAPALLLVLTINIVM